ncbi:MAG: RICIN domain-containing protein [Ruminococcus sp.]|nr:RICIN domain-containing protein [Ruminococcus sp.]
MRKIISVLLAAIIMLSITLIAPLHASALSQGDVVNWMASKNGTTINDGGTQCVAAFNSYLRLWGISSPISMYPVGSAYQIFNYDAPSGWQKISGSGNYQVGDVVIWDSSIGRGHGHVGMVYSTSGTVQIFDQNWVSSNVCGIHNLSNTGAIRGVFRPPLGVNPFPGPEDTSWNVPVWKTAKYKANTYDSYGSQESNRWIDQGDNCYIEKVYQNGYVWVKYPSSASSDGYRWAFTKADVFPLEKKGNSFPGEEDTSWNVPVWKTANSALNTYDESGNQESNRWIDQGDNCYIEHVYKNGYAWVKYPSSASSDGWRWAYTVASGFSLEKKNWYSGQSPVNVGTDFYAYIINTSPWKHLTNDNNNVSIRTETGEANQVWKFDRLSDGSYRIINVADGKALDDYNLGTSDGSNVQVWDTNDSNAQKWFIYGESGAYYLRAACGDLVLDVNGGASSDGTNVQMWTKNDSAAQKFQIWKLNKAGQTQVYCQEGSSITPTIISWDVTTDTLEYEVRVWKGTAQEGDPFITRTEERGNSCSINLPVGDYEACVYSKNNYSTTISANTVKFTVTQGVIIGDINNDNTINMKDIVLLQQYMNGWEVTINEPSADVNNDGKTNMKDIVLLQQYMNGWDVSLG